MSKSTAIIPLEIISTKIFYIRNEKVMLDFDLADLYGIETKFLKRAVRRNIDRFPKDFMIKLNRKEMENLRCQIGTSSWGGLRYAPYAFTEQGVAMLSSVLNSERAIKVNIAIMRAFVRMRQILQSSVQLAKKLEQLEKETKEKFAEQQEQIAIIFEAIKELMIEKDKPKRKIGY